MSKELFEILFLMKNFIEEKFLSDMFLKFVKF